MKSFAEISRCLLEDEDGVQGSVSRDINFEGVTRDKLIVFLEKLTEEYNLSEAIDHEGKDLRSEILSKRTRAVLDNSVSISLNFSSTSAVIKRFLALIDLVEGVFEIELSFFPDDLDGAKFSGESFVKLIEAWANLLDAREYYVRYENASWRLVPEETSGIIYKGSELQQPNSQKKR